jgi:hypothetical protein
MSGFCTHPLDKNAEAVLWNGYNGHMLLLKLLGASMKHSSAFSGNRSVHSCHTDLDLGATENCEDYIYQLASSKLSRQQWSCKSTFVGPRIELHEMWTSCFAPFVTHLPRVSES